MVYETFSSDETEAIGFNIAKNAFLGRVYCLTGELGAGKTVFTKGFAKGLGIEDEITSPTFTIVNEYKGKTNFYHFDAYRLKGAEDMVEIGYEEYFFGDGICLVEWADIILDIIPDDAVWIKIRKDPEKGYDYRMIEEVVTEDEDTGH